MDLDKKRWKVLIASCVINLCIGSMYAWSVFAAPMAEYLHYSSAGDLAIVFTVTNGVGPITMIWGGKMIERLGTQWVIRIGGVLFCIGMIASGFANSRAALIVFYGLCSGFGLGMVYGCTISNSVKFFPERRGLVGGLTTAVYGMSSVVVPPLANGLIQSAGVHAAFRILGLIFLVLIGVCSLFIITCPAGYRPAGWKADSNRVSNCNETDWRGMLTSATFYAMLIMLTCGAVSGLMIISQASAIAQRLAGLTADSAAISVSILALFNVFGRIAIGGISDKIGRINSLRCAMVASVLGLAALSLTAKAGTAMYYIGVSIIGISFGAFMGVYPGFTAEQFGEKNNSVNYGIMFIGFAVAGLVGPSIMNSAVKASGSYFGAFRIAVILSVSGFILSLFWKRFQKNQ